MKQNEFLAAPPAILVEQKDGSLKGFSKKEINVAGHELDRFSHLFELHGFDYGHDYCEFLKQLHPKEFANFIEAYEKLWEAQMAIEE